MIHHFTLHFSSVMSVCPWCDSNYPLSTLHFCFPLYIFILFKSVIIVLFHAPTICSDMHTALKAVQGGSAMCSFGKIFPSFLHVLPSSINHLFWLIFHLSRLFWGLYLPLLLPIPLFSNFNITIIILCFSTLNENYIDRCYTNHFLALFPPTVRTDANQRTVKLD